MFSEWREKNGCAISLGYTQFYFHERHHIPAHQSYEKKKCVEGTHVTINIGRLDGRLVGCSFICLLTCSPDSHSLNVI